MTLQACVALVERGDPDRFLAAMAAPPSARARLLPFYAFNLEVARAPWVTQEPMIAEMRLQWWRDTLTEIRQGGPVRAHEVATPLAAAISDTQLPIEPLDRLVVARRWDIERAPFADNGALWAHLDATSGTLMWATTQVLGGTDEAVARAVGQASGMASWLIAVPELLACGRDPLPDHAPDAIRQLAEAGLERLSAARRVRNVVPRRAVPALLAAWRAGTILGMALRQPERVTTGQLVQSEFSRRGTLLLRTATGRW